MNKLLCMVLVAFVVYLVFIKDSSCPMSKEKSEGFQSCSNIPPDNQYSCPQQAGWGKCKELWMVNNCFQSCGRCELERIKNLPSYQTYFYKKESEQTSGLPFDGRFDIIKNKIPNEKIRDIFDNLSLKDKLNTGLFYGIISNIA